MKKKLLAFTTLDQKNRARDGLIVISQQERTFVKWSDYAVETKDCLYIFKVVPVIFPIQEFAGFDEVEAHEILEELENYVFELQEYLSKPTEVEPETTESPDSDKNGEDDRNDGESNESSETDINDENNREEQL